MSTCLVFMVKDCLLYNGLGHSLGDILCIGVCLQCLLEQPPSLLRVQVAQFSNPAEIEAGTDMQKR